MSEREGGPALGAAKAGGKCSPRRWEAGLGGASRRFGGGQRPSSGSRVGSGLCVLRRVDPALLLLPRALAFIFHRGVRRGSRLREACRSGLGPRRFPKRLPSPRCVRHWMPPPKATDGKDDLGRVGLRGPEPSPREAAGSHSVPGTDRALHLLCPDHQEAKGDGIVWLGR